MDDADFLPTDVTECHRLLVAAYQQAVQLQRRTDNAERRAIESEQHAAQSEQRVAELDRVLDATSASFQELATRARFDTGGTRLVQALGSWSPARTHRRGDRAAASV